jgi:alpha-L-rhamnosidase
LNQIQQATLWSYVSNAHSIPTDCPTREKNGWTADAHLAAEQALYNFDVAAFYSKWMDDFDDAQRKDGQLPGIIPSGGWGYTSDIGPAWDSALFLIPWYVYLYCGDQQILTAHYPTMQRYLDWMARQAPEGIAAFGLGDWVAFDTKTSSALTSTAYYHEDARIAAHTARLLGRKDNETSYSALAERLRQAWQKQFFDAATASVDNNSQTALSCALYFHLLPPEHEAAVFEKLLSAVEKRDYHLDTGILGAKYVMQVLLDRGRADVACRIAMQKTLPGWGWWIDQGATTLWEDWRGEASLNHIMFGDVSAWFYKALAGLALDEREPGFGRATIRPQVVGGLTHAEADYHSVRGRWGVAWKVKEGRFELSVQVPANASAEVHVPCAELREIREGGKPVKEAEGVRVLQGGQGSSVVEVGAGSYRFDCPAPGNS